MSEQAALFEQPTQDKLDQLKAKYQSAKQKSDAILSDPVFESFEAIAARLDKLVKEYHKITKDLPKLRKEMMDELLKSFVPKIEEPTEDGFYIFIEHYIPPYGNDDKVETSATLLQKALGIWINVEDGVGYGNGYRTKNGKRESFEDFLGIGSHTIEATLIKYEGSEYPNVGRFRHGGMSEENIAHLAKFGIGVGDESDDEDGDDE